MKTRKIIYGLITLLLGVVICGVLNLQPLEGVGLLTLAFPAIIGGLKSSKELKESKGEIWQKAKDIITLSKEGKRDLTDDETTEYDGHLAKMKDFDIEIKRAEETEKRMAEMAGAYHNKENEKKGKNEVRSYSFLKAIRAKVEGRSLEGIEAEMHQEAVKEARLNGLSVSGIGIPSIVLGAEKRDLTAGTDSEGGYTVKDDMGELIPALRKKLLILSLGARYMGGLTGNVPIPRQATKASATWEGENDATAETSPTFEKAELTPHRLAAFTDLSKQLIIQSSIGAEQFVRSDLEKAIRLALDYAAINGSGSSNQPTGILNVSGIGTATGGTNGLAPTWDHIVKLEKELAVDDADIGKLAYLTNPKVRAKLKVTALDTGSGLFIWPKDNKLNGYNTGVTTQIPSDLDKGTSTGVCSAIIFGNFDDLIIGQWGGLDVVVDNFTKAKEGQIVLVINSYWDIAVRHAESFAAMVDALT